MTASAPTILATSGGIAPGTRSEFEFGKLVHYGVELAGVNGRRPRICHIGTALGDQRANLAAYDEAARHAGFELTHCILFPMPNTAHLDDLLLSQDLIWVGGGSVANLLAVWGVHGLDSLLHRAWQSGIVLAGVSAGSLCWHVGGTTDSFGPELRPVTNGLAFLPFGNGVHYDSEARRRPMMQSLVADGSLPTSYATDDYVGLHYEGTTMVEAVAELPGRYAYLLEREGTRAHESQLPTRLLT
ncbi:MAG: Type 1 glutamine amidotransferase-like domain-containing protein [Acidimicrobiales bacterium]